MKTGYSKIVMTAMLLLSFSVELSAVVAKPGLGVYGDEYGHYRINAGESMYAPDRKVSGLKRLPQIDATFPTQGEVRSLVILVNFSDVSFSVDNPKEAFYKMLNESGYSENGGTGSARDYFIASSNGVFRPSFDVYGPVTLPQKRSYYGKTDGDAVQMVTDACDILEDEIDWSMYDENGDGDVDNIFIYFAGHSEAEGGPEESVWPHRYYVFTEREGQTIRYYYKGKDGKQYWLWDYACTSELSGDRGTRMCGIGTFCHEFSHVLGLDDLYDTSDSEKYTVGAWDIMCYGNYNNDGRTPPSFSAFERFMIGWMKPEQLVESKDCILEPIETTNTAYLISSKEHNMDALNPNPIEYWLVENRQRVGWDKPGDCLPGTGLLISHIYWNKKKWDNNKPNNSNPFVYDICEAWYNNPSTSTGTDTYPGMYNVMQFVPTGVNGNILSGQSLSNIRVFSGTSVAFHFGENTGAGLYFTPEVPAIMRSTLFNGRSLEKGVDILALEGVGIQDTLVKIYTNLASFEISLDSIEWTTEPLQIPVAEDSTCSATIYVRYQPAIICSSHMGLLYAQTSNRQQFAQVTLYGESKRATLITPVTAYNALEVTPYSFTARWDQQEDAEEYQLAVYTIKEEPLMKKYKPNVRMSQTGTTYLTEYALLPYSSLDVSIGQTYSSEKNDFRGCVYAEALTGDQRWVRVDSIPVRALSSTVQRTYNFKDEDYHQFRFTYRTLAGSHYVTLASVTYTVSAQPVYLFKDTVETIFAPISEYVIKDLQPGTEYFYALRAAENKGCEPHVTTMGNTISVRTLPGPKNADRQFMVRNNAGVVTAYLPDNAKEGSELRVYDPTGTLLSAYPLDKDMNTFVLPTEGLTHGRIYLVKYCTEDKVSYKGLWSKFIY
ncbi:MAG: M6 family metalloprotease domain-containing protein [Paludibacteraceae bacterium]|nr:M6 family metalloprotease domain-containing protein [Paludibacteraceae bacterium]